MVTSNSELEDSDYDLSLMDIFNQRRKYSLKSNNYLNESYFMSLPPRFRKGNQQNENLGGKRVVLLRRHSLFF